MQVKTKNAISNFGLMIVTVIICSELISRCGLPLIFNLLLGFGIGFFWINIPIFKEESTLGKTSND